MTELRHQALNADAAALGMAPSDRFPNVFGVVMDTAYEIGVATLVAFADGTTSLYTSTGSGIIGGGAHAQVVKAVRALLRIAEDHRSEFSPDPSDEPPPVGSVTMRLLLFSGRVAVTEEETALGEGQRATSPLFHAAHAVIAELRHLDEAGGS